MYPLVTSWDLQAKMTCLRIKSLLVTGSPQIKISWISIMFNPQHLLKLAQLRKGQVKASRTLRDSLGACEGTRRHWCLQGIHRLKDGDEKINRYLDSNVKNTNTEGKRESNTSRCSMLGASSITALHRILEPGQSSIFSNFHLLKCQILTSTPNYGFNGEREEIPDSKVFPSSQTPASYLPHGRITASQLCFAFPHQDSYLRPCCIWNALPWCREHIWNEHGYWEWKCRAAWLIFKWCEVSLFFYVPLLCNILALRSCSSKPKLWQ